MFKPNNAQPGILSCREWSSSSISIWIYRSRLWRRIGWYLQHMLHYKCCRLLSTARTALHEQSNRWAYIDLRFRTMAQTITLVSVSAGALCPLDYPHVYNGGKDCCSSPWRDLIPGNSTCDGGILQVADSCCPAGKSISCNIDSTYMCQTNPKYGKYREADNTSSS